MSNSVSSDRNQNHSEPTAHRADWREDQGLVDDLTTEIEDCRRAHPANAAAAAPPAAGNAAPAAGNLPGLPAPSQVAPTGPAHPGPAHSATNNAAPVAPVASTSTAATVPNLAGAQGQTNPSGPGQSHINPLGAAQGQGNQLNDEDDGDEDQDAEHEQDGQPVVNNENVTVEEQEEQSTGTNDPAALVLDPAFSTTAGTQGHTDPPGAEQGQADQPIVVDEDNHDSQQDAEYEEEFTLNFSPIRPDERDRLLNARYEHGTSTLSYQHLLFDLFDCSH